MRAGRRAAREVRGAGTRACGCNVCLRLWGTPASWRGPPVAGPVQEALPCPTCATRASAGAVSAKGRGTAPHPEADGGADGVHQPEELVDDLVRLRLEC
eukprot:scaffold104542_cov51-Phaeocystis_antarctica.AAC.1